MKKRIGFAVIAAEQRKEISRRGGKASHVAGTAHEWTTEEAKAAGRKGGIACHAKRRAAARAAAEKTFEADPAASGDY